MVIKNTNFTEDLTACKLELSAHNNGAHIDNRFDITLSVSTQIVRTKTEGSKLTAFETIIIDTTDEDQVRGILTRRNYSTNVWSGACSNATYIGMTGVILDFDGTLTIDQARDLFYGYHYILHTSASHQVKEPKGDRFRVILPFAPGDLRFTTPDECRMVYRKLLGLYPAADAACVDPARKYFPHTDELGAEFILEINSAGHYFDIDISDTTNDAVEDYEPRTWDGILQPKAELDRVMKFCPFVRWMDKHIDDKTVHISEPLKYALISNLCWFEGGQEAIHGILRRDVRPEKYDPEVIDEKIDRVRGIGPHKYATIARLSTVNAGLWGWTGNDWKGPASPAGWAKFGRIVKREASIKDKKAPQDIHIGYNDHLITETNGQWQVVDLAQLKNELLIDDTKLRAVCPFCDSDTAMIKNNTFHFTYLHCDDCDKTYYEHPDTPALFTYNGKLLRVEMKSDRFINHEELKAVNFRNDFEWNYACKVVMNDPKRRFLSSDFRVERIGSAEFERLDYDLCAEDNAIIYKFPAIPVQIEDNAFIDRFLDGLFREHTDFMKNWMALFSYTNFISLPVIVLTGARSCGKNTFADMVGEIFPTLKGTWDGDKEPFNDFGVKKLVFVDENRNSEKPTQYAEIKKLTGNRMVKINEKHIRQYYVRNNAKFIFATNDPRPIALHWREEPESENTNNFFIYSCPPLTQQVDRELFDKLKARLGHYVRTELKQRYEAQVKEGISSSRYALKTPITDLAKKLFGSSKSLIELEAEELAQYLVCGINRVDANAKYPTTIYFTPTKVDGALYVQQYDIRDLVANLRFKGHTNYKSYITVLQDQGVLSYKNDHRESKQRLGYQLLRSPEYYTTVSGVMPVDTSNSSCSSKYSVLCKTTSDLPIFE